MEELVFDNWENLPSLAECEGAELAELCRAILDSKKGERVAVIRVEGRSDITDYLVLCSALSNTHVKALADELEFRLAQRGLHPIHTDGGNGRNWQAWVRFRAAPQALWSWLVRPKRWALPSSPCPA